MDNGSAFLGFTHETDNLYNRLFLKNWSFTSSFQSNKQDPWSGLSLDYNIEWPLHLLLNQDTIERYNQLFRFLLPIKRVQLELHTAWQQKVKTMKNMSDNELFRQAMQLRQHMQFLIDNIYSYLQVDVLEALWLQL
jgi:gamma-tubulin complex component 4